MKIIIETVGGGLVKRRYSDDFERVLASDIYDIACHFLNAIEEKHRKVLDKLVMRETDRNPKKLSIEAKHGFIKDVELESAKKRTIGEDAELMSKGRR